MPVTCSELGTCLATSKQPCLSWREQAVGFAAGPKEQERVQQRPRTAAFSSLRLSFLSCAMEMSFSAYLPFQPHLLLQISPISSTQPQTHTLIITIQTHRTASRSL